MNRQFLWLAGIIGLMTLLPLHATDQPSLPERYAAIYVGINTAEQAERKGDYRGALQGFKDCYLKLSDICQTDPDWETALVLHRLADLKTKILELQPKVDGAAQANKAPVPGATNAVPAVAPTNLPPNLPPEVKAFQDSLPRLEAQASSPSADFIFITPHATHNIYPWRANVLSELIWIGMDGRKSSVWDPNWVRDFNGEDTPDNRNGFAPGGHACGLNPFYVVLPFNDLAHPDLARQWLPRGWTRAARDGKPISACKDRWVELKNVRGDVCYAQWEDAGPKGDDRASYVFGDDRPGKDESGIGLSPAAGEYLGMSNETPFVSWRFVDEADVRPGAWLKLDEQAVMFTAMRDSSAK